MPGASRFYFTLCLMSLGISPCFALNLKEPPKDVQSMVSASDVVVEDDNSETPKNTEKLLMRREGSEGKEYYEKRRETQGHEATPSRSETQDTQYTLSAEADETQTQGHSKGLDDKVDGSVKEDHSVHPGLNLPKGIPGRPVAADLMEVFDKNEKTRSGIRDWITPGVLLGSVSDYGIEGSMASFMEESSKPRKHKKKTTNPTSDDFVSQLGSRLDELLSSRKDGVNYLDIGAGVLDGIHTQSQFLKGGIMAAWDLEDPNPVIEGLWRGKSVVDSWPASPYRKQHGRTHDYINKYHDSNFNIFYYLAGDIFNKTASDKFQRHVVGNYGDFNLIRSNAQNSSKGVKDEIDVLIAHKIIKPKSLLAMVWTNCQAGNGVYDGVHAAFPKLQSLHPKVKTCMGSLDIPGKLEGSTQGLCVYATLDLSGPHLGASKKWKPLKHNITCQGGPKDSDAGLQDLMAMDNIGVDINSVRVS